MVTAVSTGEDVSALREKINAGIETVSRMRQRAEAAEAELSLVESDRDRALYCLLRLCEAADRQHWPIDAESLEVFHRITDLLLEHDITPGLDEPSEATLRLLERIAAADEREQAEYESFNV